MILRPSNQRPVPSGKFEIRNHMDKSKTKEIQFSDSRLGQAC
jgi:hypothetical protein